MLYTVNKHKNNKLSKQNVVVELKTLFFFFEHYFIFFCLVLFISFPTGERWGMGVVLPTGLTFLF